MSKLKSFGVLILSLLLFFSFAISGQAISENNVPKVNIVASSANVNVDGNFEVAIWLQGFMEEYGGLEGFQVRLKYDPKIIVPVLENDVSQLNTEGVFSSSSNPMTFANKIGSDGTIEFAQSLSSSNEAFLFTGYAKLGTITFKAVQEGEAKISVDKSIVIKPGNAGVNIKHQVNHPTIVVGNGSQVADKIEILGEAPKTEMKQRSTSDILQGFKDHQQLAQMEWAMEGTAKLANLKIINGMPDGNFYPQRNMTRAEFAKVVVLGLGLDMKQKMSPTFKDIKKSDWFYDYVETAAAYDLIKGVEKGDGRYYNPQEPISRAEIATILSRALVNLKGYTQGQGLSSPFVDIAGYSWAEEHILLLYDLGIIKGKSDTSFAPGDSANRAEISVMLSRLLEKN